MNKDIEYFEYKALLKFWFGLFLIDSTGDEAKIQVATCDHIQNPKFSNLVFDSTSIIYKDIEIFQNVLGIYSGLDGINQNFIC